MMNFHQPVAIFWYIDRGSRVEGGYGPALWTKRLALTSKGEQGAHNPNVKILGVHIHGRNDGGIHPILDRSSLPPSLLKFTTHFEGYRFMRCGDGVIDNNHFPRIRQNTANLRLSRNLYLAEFMELLDPNPNKSVFSVSDKETRYVGTGLPSHLMWHCIEVCLQTQLWPGCCMVT